METSKQSSEYFLSIKCFFLKSFVLIKISQSFEFDKFCCKICRVATLQGQISHILCSDIAGYLPYSKTRDSQLSDDIRNKMAPSHTIIDYSWPTDYIIACAGLICRLLSYLWLRDYTFLLEVNTCTEDHTHSL